MRSYTVNEIDYLRSVVENKYIWGVYNPQGLTGSSRCFDAKEKDHAVEERVRTFVLAGITAQDLLDSERKGT